MRDSKPVGTASDSESKLVKKTDEKEDVDQKLYAGSSRSIVFVHEDKTRHFLRSWKRCKILL